VPIPQAVTPLCCPQVFDLEVFRDDPTIFYRVASLIMPKMGAKPSKAHEFIAALESRGKLLRNYTRNIDGLEDVAGITKVVRCHGSLRTASCMRCRQKVPFDAIASVVSAGGVPVCSKCCPGQTQLDARVEEEDSSGGEDKRPRKRASAVKARAGFAAARTFDVVKSAVMKPDIVFFRESLPSSYTATLMQDLKAADLFVVMGSSLQVQPVAGVLAMLPPTLPAVLINRELVAKEHRFDVEMLGRCDDVVRTLAARLRWDEDDSELLAHPTFTEPNRYEFPYDSGPGTTATQ
jgi:NAD-dependent SIR2 family protein deacetylase